MGDRTQETTPAPTPIPPTSILPSLLQMAPFTTPFISTTLDLSGIPLLQGKSNTATWLQVVELNLQACRIWHLCEEGVTEEILKANQSVVEWLTPSLMTRMVDTLQQQGLAEGLHKKNPQDVIQWVD